MAGGKINNASINYRFQTFSADVCVLHTAQVVTSQSYYMTTYWHFELPIVSHVSISLYKYRPKAQIVTIYRFHFNLLIYAEGKLHYREKPIHFLQSPPLLPEQKKEPPQIWKQYDDTYCMTVLSKNSKNSSISKCQTRFCQSRQKTFSASLYSVSGPYTALPSFISLSIRCSCH